MSCNYFVQVLTEDSNGLREFSQKGLEEPAWWSHSVREQTVNADQANVYMGKHAGIYREISGASELYILQ